MKLIISTCIIFAGLIFQSNFAAADTLPRRQVRLSIYNVQQTPTGRELLSPVSENGYEKLFDTLFFDDISNKKLFSVSLSSNKFSLTYNQHLMAASPVYISWALAQALADYKVLLIAAKYGVYDLKNYYERSHIQIIKAAQHWFELGSPNSHDYVDNPKEKINWFPRSTHSSVREFDQAWRRASMSDFLQKITQRHIFLGYTKISIYEDVKKAQGPKKQALQAIIKYYENLTY